MTTGQSDGDNVSDEVPSFQVALVFVKLTPKIRVPEGVPDLTLTGVFPLLLNS